MKNIRIKELTASNFRSLNFHDTYANANTISGRNASGKSTRIAAWNWLLSGFTDANSPANSRLFDDKVELSENTPTASVKAVVSIDGEDYTIERRATAAFQRKRGTNETVKSSSDTYEYYIDDIARSATAFKEWLEEHIAPEDMLRFVLSGDFFVAKIFDDKKAARAIIERLVGTVTREEMQGDYSCIDELLKRYSLDEIEERAKSLCKGIDARLNEIPALIQSKESEIAEIEQTDFAQIENDIERLEQERSNLDKQMTDLSERIKPQMEAKHKAEQDQQMKKDVLEKAYFDWRKSFDTRRETLNSEINAIKQQNEKSRNARDIASSNKETAMKNKDWYTKLLEQAKQQRERLLKERDEEKARTFDASTALCPFCGQHLEGEKLQEQIDKFEQKKRETINHIVFEGKSVAEEIKRYENEIAKQQAIIDTHLPEVITQSTEELENKLSELIAFDTSRIAFMETEQGRTLCDDIGSVVIPEVTMPDNTEIVNAKKEVNDKLVPLYERRGLKKRLQTLRDTVNELRTEQKEKGALLADYERQRQAVKDYKQEQMEILSRKVNDGLKFSRLEVWSKQKDGTVVPDLVLKDANGVSFATTNGASRIRVTADLQRIFCERLGVNMPLWIDESSILQQSNIPHYDNVQTFLLFCSETSLKIERYE